MKRSVWGKRGEVNGLYCGNCAEVGFNRKVFVDLGETCVVCRSVVTRDGDQAYKWRAPNNLERMAFAVEKGREKPAKQGRCKCRGPKRLCKCAGGK